MSFEMFSGIIYVYCIVLKMNEKLQVLKKYLKDVIKNLVKEYDLIEIDDIIGKKLKINKNKN